MEQLYARPGHLTAAQARETLGISAGALRQLVHRGQLTRTGGSERYPTFATADVIALVAKRTARTAA